VREVLKMTSTFVHEDKHIPPDEFLDVDAPFCCDRRMWLVRTETRIGPDGVTRRREYDCKACGAEKTQESIA
jgi:hypothetical protein